MRLRCAHLSFLYRVGVAPTTRARLASRRAIVGTLADYQLLGTKKSRRAYFPAGSLCRKAFQLFSGVYHSSAIVAAQ